MILDIIINDLRLTIKTFLSSRSLRKKLNLHIPIEFIVPLSILLEQVNSLHFILFRGYGAIGQDGGRIVPITARFSLLRGVHQVLLILTAIAQSGHAQSCCGVVRGNRDVPTES